MRSTRLTLVCILMLQYYIRIPTANNLDCGTQWTNRGFMALCLNTRYFNNETAIRWETIILDLRSGINFLKTQLGINKVVLVGSFDQEI